MKSPKSFLSKDIALVFVSMSMLCKNNRLNTCLPELLYIVDAKQLEKILKIFGGSKISLPTPNEFSRELTSAIIWYYMYLEDRSWSWVADKLNLDGNKKRTYLSKIKMWNDSLDEKDKEFFYSIKGKNINL